MLPIDVVVELLMLNVNYRDDDDCVDLCLSVDPLVMRTGESMNDLRTKVREYLLTLVPKPVLLSECEEGKPCVRINRFGEWSVVVREGMSAYSMHNRPALR